MQICPEQERTASCQRADEDPLLQLVIVADDLTGAADAAIAFTGVTCPVRVHLNQAPARPFGVFAVNTETRSVSPASAQNRVAALAAQLLPTQTIFKKIDSIFRGNTFVEIEAAIHCFPSDMVIIAPAYPALGRRVRDGVLEISDLSGHRSVPIASTLAQHGCHAALLGAGMPAESLAQQLQNCVSAAQNTVLCDAVDQSDLENTVIAAQSVGMRVLWIGSGGLAHALASVYAPLPPGALALPDSGSALFFIGSDHAVTQQQVFQLQEQTGVTSFACTGNSTPVEDSQVLAVIRGKTTEGDICRALANVRPGTIRYMFMTGGDTALLVCRALGIENLRLEREIAPGVPFGYAECGAFHGTPILLKSGAFGDRDLLCHIHSLFQRKQEVQT